MLKTVFLSSLHRVFPDQCPVESAVSQLSCLENEPLSFQAAFRLDDVEARSLLIYPRIETELPVSLYYLGYVPVMHTHTGHLSNLPQPGLFGDMLLPKQVNPPLEEHAVPWSTRLVERGEDVTLNAADDCWQSVWLCVNEKQRPLKPGKYPITLRFYASVGGELLSESTFTVEIVAARLPKQKLMYTNWFHYDCLSDFYNEPVFSDRFFEIMRDYVEKAVRNGMNMLLMPAFTPPLDTPEGTYRKTAQLVKVTREKDEYSFDFSLMKRFLDVCRQAGMEYFEHSHLFTQWGAKAAPKIMATVNGKEKRLFGWDTDASGKEYSKFLHAYLPAVRAFLREEKLEKKVLFHISDEPSEGNADSYARAVATVGDLLDGCMCGDALSEYLFYEKGFVKTPIVVTPRVDDFAGRCDNLWAYYTGGQLQEGLSNRIMVVPPERNRMLGIQLYAYRIKGFLHWAYNFYYDVLSHGLFDPKCNPCGYNNHAGTTYFVFPGKDGTALQSARQKVFFEGINDMRALEALEKRSGRAACDALIEKHFGRVTFHTCPASPEALLAFREELNRLAAQEEE